MKINKIITLVMALVWFGSCCTNQAFAQQDSQYTQYMYNTVTVNPAYAGNRGMLSINNLYRAQWIGLDGAPETMTLSLNTPIGRKGVGLGLSFYQDNIGPSRESNIAMDYSYTIPVSDNAKLSFGLKGGFNLLNVNFSRPEIVYNPTDPNVENISNRLSPTIGVGLYFHSKEQWYIGLSSPNILETNHYDDLYFSTTTEKVSFYLISGYVFELNNDLTFKPAILAKTQFGAPISLDLSANFLINNKFALGAAYRLDAAVSALAGFQISDALMLGYAYDYDTMELGNYNSGSHEIFIRYELMTRLRKTVCPRFF